MSEEIDLRTWGYAPGGYVFTCHDCPKVTEFKDAPIGDKYSWRCRAHALEAMERAKADVPRRSEAPLCPDTIRACIEAVAHGVYAEAHDNEWDSGFNHAKLRTVQSLEALLPQPDHAQELLERFHKADDMEELPGGNMADRAIRWLLSNNIIDTSKLGGE